MKIRPLHASLIALASGFLASTAYAAPPPPLPAVARRYIAVIAVEKCPIIKDFKASKLFPKAPQTSPLRRFCVYASASLQAKPSSKGFKRIDHDRDIVLPQSLASDPDVRKALAKAYLASLGAFGGHPLQSIYRNTTALPQIAIVDTADDRTSGGVLAKHGQAMALIAETARCPMGEQGCQERTVFFNAFPNATNAPDVRRRPALVIAKSRRAENTIGVGSLGTVAEAIARASDESSHVVINLSLGWEPQLAKAGGKPHDIVAAHNVLILGSSEDVPAPVQAVHAALVYASCRGALTIAAAGNNTGGACAQVGMMEPAAWGDLRAPTEAECRKLGFEATQRTPRDKARRTPPGKLIYAVGGIMPSGDLLPISRRNGRPPRVVPAYMAVDAGSSIDPWTGTSVAAAALSGLAAAVWTYKPDLSGHEVINFLDNTGTHSTKLDLEHTVRIWGNKVHDTLCAKIPGCIIGSQQSKSYSLEAVDNAIAAEPNPVPAEISAATHLVGGATWTSTCGDKATYTDYSTGAHHGAHQDGFGAPLPWARPQPVSALCPVCPVKGGKLTLSLDPTQASNLVEKNAKVLLTHPRVQFYVAGTGYVSVVLPDIRLDATTSVEIDLSPYEVNVILEGKKKQVNLVDVLASPQIEAGTLTVGVEDQQGKLVPTVSVIPVFQ